jgi:hypothetical protein
MQGICIDMEENLKCTKYILSILHNISSISTNYIKRI